MMMTVGGMTEMTGERRGVTIAGGTIVTVVTTDGMIGGMTGGVTGGMIGGRIAARREGTRGEIAGRGHGRIPRRATRFKRYDTHCVL